MGIRRLSRKKSPASQGDSDSRVMEATNSRTGISLGRVMKLKKHALTLQPRDLRTRNREGGPVRHQRTALAHEWPGGGRPCIGWCRRQQPLERWRHVRMCYIEAKSGRV